jgi:hypothetical protein
MNLLKTDPGDIVNLDQTWLIQNLTDRFLFRFVNGNDHEVLKKHLPEGEADRISKSILDKTA